MAIVKTSDIVGSSPKGWEDAVRAAVERASRTLIGLQEVEVTRLNAKIEGGNIVEYRAHVKIHFLLDEELPLHE
ncbi:MAG: dodecin domain-containing protein [Candidatus Abyssobacteria bacterium SURF_17]|uniref:Dodecin domain-containing protein n=1 Tax=Candidatus Abyssobacteria bacterium SURF_17 TaxID=2093361 RepID=A0A419F967_9BACT|nr:MAG: dodecin domain-containing protein [Candidatus Abyssubacteria bacterium SURF_17]